MFTSIVVTEDTTSNSTTKEQQQQKTLGCCAAVNHHTKRTMCDVDQTTVCFKCVICGQNFCCLYHIDIKSEICYRCTEPITIQFYIDQLNQFHPMLVWLNMNLSSRSPDFCREIWTHEIDNPKDLLRPLPLLAFVEDDGSNSTNSDSFVVGKKRKRTQQQIYEEEEEEALKNLNRLKTNRQKREEWKMQEPEMIPFNNIHQKYEQSLYHGRPAMFLVDVLTNYDVQAYNRLYEKYSKYSGNRSMFAEVRRRGELFFSWLERLGSQSDFFLRSTHMYGPNRELWKSAWTHFEKLSNCKQNKNFEYSAWLTMWYDSNFFPNSLKMETFLEFCDWKREQNKFLAKLCKFNQ